MAIDFMAYARGQRTALDNMLQEERLLRERSEREREWEKQLLDRQAAGYLSTSTTNQQLAADAGIAPIDYMIQQREQTLADPNFQQMPPALQQAIVEQMRGQAVLMAQNAYNQGNMADANRLVSAYGNLPLASQFQTAGLSGNVAQIVQAMNEQFGTNAVLSEDGQSVTVNGTTMPAAEYARQAWASGSGSGGLTALAAWQEAQRVEQARQAEIAQARMDAGLPPIATPGAAGAAPAAPGAAPAAPGVPETQDERLNRILREQRDAVMQAQGLQQGADGQWYQPGDPRLPAAAAPASVADVARAAAEQEILGARSVEDSVLRSPSAWLGDVSRFIGPPGPSLSRSLRVAQAGLGAGEQVRDFASDRLQDILDTAYAGSEIAGIAGQNLTADLRQNLPAELRPAAQASGAVADAIRALYERAVPDYRRNPEAARERWAQSQAGGLAEAGGEVAALRERLSRNLIQQSSPTVSATTKARLRREAAQIRQQIEGVQDGS